MQMLSRKAFPIIISLSKHHLVPPKLLGLAAMRHFALHAKDMLRWGYVEAFVEVLYLQFVMPITESLNGTTYSAPKEFPKIAFEIFCEMMGRGNREGWWSSSHEQQQVGIGYWDRFLHYLLSRALQDERDIPVRSHTYSHP